MNFLLIFVIWRNFTENQGNNILKKWAVTKNEGFTDKSVRQGGAD